MFQSRGESLQESEASVELSRLQTLRDRDTRTRFDREVRSRGGSSQRGGGCSQMGVLTEGGPHRDYTQIRGGNSACVPGGP